MKQKPQNLNVLKPKYTFDAFVSHAWEDKEPVRWLVRFLSTFRVFGRLKRRRIFLNEQRLVAGALDDRLRNEVNSAHYFLLCCSEESVSSEYVNTEILWWLDPREEGTVDQDRLSRTLLCYI